jgi:DNA-binding NtrC family response regulator
MKKIKKLIENGYLNEAEVELDKELSKSFNFSESKSRSEYIVLRKMKNLLERILDSKKKEKKGKGEALSNIIMPIQNFDWLTNLKESAIKIADKTNLVAPHIKKRENELFAIAKTNDNSYKEDLAALAYAIDEENTPILFCGEIGVGKSFLAEKIHTISKRKTNKFVTVNCAGMNETNLYPNLFGAEKGSFTGSFKELKGMIKEADGGTLFIDEIDKAPRDIRYHLMTFIDTKKFYPLGSEKFYTADIRILVGTNKDLKQLVAKGEFEPDLYSRISGRIINIPALRERKKDIPLLIDTVIKEYKAKNKNPIKVEMEAFEYLVNYFWPQNARQLIYYLLQSFGDCHRSGVDTLTLEMINNKPPESTSVYTSSDFIGFESTIKNYLDNWETNSGKYLNDFVEPVVAKIYLEDYNPQMNKSTKYEDASNIIGISGDRRASSTLHQRYLKYKEIKKKYS